ncbi:hypothetical protein ACFUOZ_00630 [Paenarthrobacter sp. NPDC057355]|uniref:hypothetical protein n=1 Tax=Paenarthrobacter sp. NPDC057355 TaxID=3346105 RepID=UPI00363CCC80
MTLTDPSNDVYATWLDHFDQASSVTPSALAEFQEEVSHTRYAETVLRLARAGKLSPELLADATYSAWLSAENPKKVMAGGDWAELFRLANKPDHEFFERLS